MSLRPILEGARGWTVPADTAGQYGACHFAARAGERGVRSIPGHLLMWVVLEARRLGRADLVERVYDMGDGATLYRILLPEGAYYPVARGDRLVTIYSPREKRQMAVNRRFRKRHFGTRMQRAV
ncbi:hypothetical protein [Leisingera sp. F5]|uniref:hypothetical protein n=1 Tax=Leisingera sp. F5 TaxID=1813816 RepID=UPI000ACF631F|nr:hypothetical protein [Leisingera sp. F5]